MQIGKTKIALTAEGCLSCGTRWSSAWAVTRVVPVKIGTKESILRIYLCAACISSPSQEDEGGTSITAITGITDIALSNPCNPKQPFLLPLICLAE